MCKFATNWSSEELLEIGIGFNVELLNNLSNDGLIYWDEFGIEILDTGRPFIRNICMALDSRLWNAQKFSRFSQTV